MDKDNIKYEIRMYILKLESLATDFGIVEDEWEEDYLLNEMTLSREHIFKLLEEL
ncbi:hypothetical protein [Holdemanella porci]|uniref:hypothetical protein n=1 Tax=Holdemanella porci TaxID=2652276 RepID=UPI003AB1D670